MPMGKVIHNSQDYGNYLFNPSIKEWIDKTDSKYIMEYFISIKKKEMTPAT